jgi:hypothetical protein
MDGLKALDPNRPIREADICGATWDVGFVPMAGIASGIRVRGRQPSRPKAPSSVAKTRAKMKCALAVQCGSLDFLICSARATLQSTHIRVGSIGLVYATHIGAQHCAHWLMNEREIGINMSATSGHARTSADLSAAMLLSIAVPHPHARYYYSPGK